MVIDKRVGLRVDLLRSRILPEETRVYWDNRLAIHKFRRGMETDRGLDLYNEFMHGVLGKDIGTHVDDIIKQKGKANILDLGAGHGIFLREIRDRFHNSVHLSALAMGVEQEQTDDLKELSHTGVIDNLFLGRAEQIPFYGDNFKGYDLIIDMFGPNFYVHKDIFYKSVLCLAKGGTFLFINSPYYGQIGIDARFVVDTYPDGSVRHFRLGKFLYELSFDNDARARMMVKRIE